MESINVKEIENIFNRIIEKLKIEIGERELKMNSDYFKLIPTEHWANFEKTDFDVGSISDDLIELKKLADDEKRYCTYVDFDRTASILRELSQTLNPI